LDQSDCLFYVADVIRQAPALQFCLQKREMVISRFVFVSDEEVSRFIEENKNENTARKTAQDVALLKSFLSEKKPQRTRRIVTATVGRVFKRVCYFSAKT